MIATIIIAITICLMFVVLFSSDFLVRCLMRCVPCATHIDTCLTTLSNTLPLRFSPVIYDPYLWVNLTFRVVALCTPFPVFILYILDLVLLFRLSLHTTLAMQSDYYREKEGRRKAHNINRARPRAPVFDKDECQRIAARLTATRTGLEQIAGQIQKILFNDTASELPFALLPSHRHRLAALLNKQSRFHEKLMKYTSELVVLSNQAGEYEFLENYADHPAAIAFKQVWESLPSTLPSVTIILAKIFGHVRNLRRCRNIGDLCDATLLFVVSEFPTASEHCVRTILNHFKKDSALEDQSGLGDMFPDLTNIDEVWKDAANARVVGLFKKILILLVVCGIMGPPTGKVGSVVYEAVAGMPKDVSSHDAFTYFMDVVTYVTSRAAKLASTGDWSVLWADLSKVEANAKEFVALTREYDIMMTSNHDNMTITIRELKTRLIELSAAYSRIIKVASAYERTVAENSYRRCAAMLTEVDLRLNSTSIVKRPFSILLVGTAGVGKSTLISRLWVPMARVNELPTGECHQTVIDASEKYQSTANNHSCFVIDDIAQVLPARSDFTIASLLIKIINNVPAYAVKADVASKGRVLLSPDFVFGTSNVPNIDAPAEVNEPAAVWRRFNYRILACVKPSLRIPGQLMLDEERALDQRDLWLLTVQSYRITGIVGNRCVGNWQTQDDAQGPLRGATLDRVNQYLNERSIEHFSRQNRLVDVMKAGYDAELCQHFRWPTVCHECNHIVDPMVIDSDLPSLHHQAGEYVRPFFIFGSAYFTSLFVTLACSRFIGAFLARRLCWFYGRRIVQTFLVFQPLIFGIGTAIGFASGSYFWVVGYYTLATFTSGALACLLQARRVMEMMTPEAHILNAREFLRGRANAMFRDRKLVLIAIATCVFALFVYLRRKDPFTQQGNTMFRSADAGALNHYQAYVTPSGDYTNSVKTTTFDDFTGKLGRHLNFADFSKLSSDGLTRVGSTCNIIPLTGTYWLVPYHTVSSEYTHVKAHRAAPGVPGSSFHQNVDPGMWVRIGNSDLAIINLRKGGTQWDMLDYFSPDILSGERHRGTLLHKSSQGSLMRSSMDLTNVGKICKSDGNVSSYQGTDYTTAFPTFKGLCMSPIVIMAAHPTVVAVHCAGMTGTSTGRGHLLNRDMIEKAINALSVTFGNEPTASLGKVEMQSCTILETLHQKSPVNFYPDSVVTMFGTTDAPRRSHHTEVVPTPLADILPKHIGILNRWKGPPMSGWLPWSTFFDGVGHNVEIQFPTLPLKRAYDDFIDTINLGLSNDMLGGLGVLSDKASLQGTPGVIGEESIDFSTGMGLSEFGIGKKSKYFKCTFNDDGTLSSDIEPPPGFFERIRENIQILQGGKRLPMVFQNCLKDEVVPLTKEKTRIISCGSVENTVLIRKYFLPLARIVRENNQLFECAVGMNCYGKQWDWMARHLMSFGEERIVCGDYKRFDQAMPPEIILLSFRILLHIAKMSGDYTQEDYDVMQVIATEIAYPVYESDGSVFMAHGSNPSGHPLTVIINSLANSLYLRYVYYSLSTGEMDSFSTNVHLMTLGDDNIMGVSPMCSFFNGAAISASLAKVGVTYTRADKSAYEGDAVFDHLRDATFLKRKFIYSDETMTYIAPIEKDSIYKSLFMIVPSKTILVQQQVAATVESAMLEAFYHGREYYESLQNGVKLSLAEADILDWVSERAWVSYDSRLIAWHLTNP